MIIKSDDIIAIKNSLLGFISFASFASPSFTYIFMHIEYNMYGSIVYNRTIVNMHQNFLKVVLHEIIIDQSGFSCHLDAPVV